MVKFKDAFEAVPEGWVMKLEGRDVVLYNAQGLEVFREDEAKLTEELVRNFSNALGKNDPFALKLLAEFEHGSMGVSTSLFGTRV